MSSKNIRITTQTLFKNEDKFIWYALSAWEPYATQMLVWNDESSDQSEEIVKGIKSSKIKYKHISASSEAQLTLLRNQMLQQTKTEWFLLLDGDEIWNNSTVTKFLDYIENQPASVYAIVMRTRNCVGDVYHYLPEDEGRYELLGKRGHLNIRAYRKLPGFRWEGQYPLEKYVDARGSSINDQQDRLSFFDNFYWHMTHLPRSSSKETVKGWRETKIEGGIKIKEEELPEVFWLPAPPLVPSPLTKRSLPEEILGKLVTPIKKIRRAVLTK